MAETVIDLGTIKGPKGDTGDRGPGWSSGEGEPTTIEGLSITQEGQHYLDATTKYIWVSYNDNGTLKWKKESESQFVGNKGERGGHYVYEFNYNAETNELSYTKKLVADNSTEGVL